MPFELKEWNIHACVCRCLVELQRRRGEQLADEDIYNFLVAEYPAWVVQPGAMDTMGFCRVVREFKIGKYVETFIDAERIFEESKRAGFVGLVGITERLAISNKPGLSKTYHGLLITPKEDQFDVWCPKGDGTFTEFQAPWSTWYQWMLKGHVIANDF